MPHIRTSPYVIWAEKLEKITDRSTPILILSAVAIITAKHLGLT
jgi:hypothetical protein